MGFIYYLINYKLNYNINYMRFRPFFFVPVCLDIMTIPKTARPPANPQGINRRDLQPGTPTAQKKGLSAFPLLSLCAGFYLRL